MGLKILVGPPESGKTKYAITESQEKYSKSFF